MHIQKHRNIHSRSKSVMNQTYIHVQIYSWQKIILASNILNIKNEPRALVIISTNTLDCNFREVSSNHIAWVPYCTAEHHAEYHAKDRETRNSNTNNSNELELNTDYGFNFVDAILFWKKKKPAVKTDCATHPVAQWIPWLSGSVH